MLYHDATALLVDVGTNGEIVLKHGDRLIGCATAAGPAFEGALLTSGVRAGTGAVAHVRLDGQRCTHELDVIGGTVPRGLCGTAYLDFLAEGRSVGLLETTGRFACDAGCCWPLRTDACGERGFVLYEEEQSADREEAVRITERDIATLLQAKAAIAAGIQCLLERINLTPSDIDTLYLAGGFGLHMNIDSAIGSGLLPGFAHDQVRLMGNTALAGAYLTLVDAAPFTSWRRFGRVSRLSNSIWPRPSSRRSLITWRCRDVRNW